MKVFIKGFGEVELGQKDFIAKGGEGEIYGKGKVAYKIYEDSSKMIPVAKMQELSVLTHPSIIKPEQLILEPKKNKTIGYTMRLVEGSVLCQLFTKAFKQRNNIDNKDIVNLVKKFHNIVDHIHQHDILLVDLNELNFLVNNSFNEIYAIDVNSYQTRNFPATVIMESVRDRHCHNKFNKETDWFSWGIVSFQMLVGIHPYKGNHPDFDNVPKTEQLNARMLKNVSVFNPKARIPKVCESLDTIPSGLKAWYQAIFEQGKRIAPPKDFEAIIHINAAVIKQIVGSNLFDIVELESYESDIDSFFSYDGNRIVILKNHVYVGKNKYDIPAGKGLFTFTGKMSYPIFVYTENNMLKVFDIRNQKHLSFTGSADDIMRCDDRIYFKNNTSVLQLTFDEIGGDIQCFSKIVGNVLNLPSATKVFDGGIIQNLLGRYYVSIFPTTGKCYQIPIPELDDYKIIDAKYENKVMVVIGVHKNGKYDRMIFKLSNEFNSYSFRKKEDVIYSGINFTVTDAGTVILINEEEDVEAFLNKKEVDSVKEINDNAISGDMKLYHDGSTVLFARGKKLYKISMRK